MVLVIMPSQTGKGYATNSFVWTEWNNETGYSSNGFVFLAGMLNGAFAIGTPDGCTHLAEEIPDPKRNIPKGIFAQLIVGFVTTFIFYIAVLYAITDIDFVLGSPVASLPLAAVYLQGTNSVAGATGLLVVFFLDILFTIPGAYIAAGRMLWTLARDDATPFPHFLGRISQRFRNPFHAQFAIGICTTILGCIFIGNQAAFSAFVGVFAILTTLSYLAAILPHILLKRQYVKPGPFWMPGIIGYLVTGIACAYIIVFNIIYMFPYALPVDAATMNYSCLMVGGLSIFITLWYLWKRNRGYVGPHVLLEANNDVLKGIIDPLK
jgi:choline transport protein